MKYIKLFEYVLDVDDLSKSIKSNDIQNVIKIVKLIPSEINSIDIHGDSPLNIACDYGNLEIVKLLIKNGADINLKAHAGFSPLAKIAYNRGFNQNHLEILKYLLLLPNIDIESKSQYDSTPLLLAIDSSKRKDHRKKFNKQLKLEAIILLLEAGADIYSQRCIFRSPKCENGFDILKTNDNVYYGDYVLKSNKFQDTIYKIYGETPFFNGDIPDKYISPDGKFAYIHQSNKYNL